MKKEKKYKYLLSLVCFISFLCLFPTSFVKADGFRSDYGFRWKGLICAGGWGNEYIQIYGYKGEETTFRIPAKMKRGQVKFLYSMGKMPQLQEVYVPNGIDISGGAFAKSPGLSKVILEKDNPDYVVKDGFLLTKDEKTLISCIGGMEYPKIPDSVTAITGSAFAGSSIREITLGKNISMIGGSAFQGCKNLEKVHFEEGMGIKRIDYSTFQGCTSLTSLVLPDSVEEIGHDAFKNCRSLETLKLSKNLKLVGPIHNCPSLRTIYFSAREFETEYWTIEDVPMIDKYSGCKEQVTIYGMEGSKALEREKKHGNNCVVLGNSHHIQAKSWNGFSYVLSQTGSTTTASIWGYTGTEKYVTLPTEIQGIPVTTLESLGESKKIASVTIPDSVQVKGRALSACKNLKTIVLSGKNPNYMVKNKLLLSRDGKTLIACPGNVKYPKIPSGVTKIADGAFSGSSIRTVTLGKNISYLGYEAFKDCVNLTLVKFSEKSPIKTIHHRTFDNCRSLKKLELPDGVKEIQDYVFYNCRSLETLKTGSKLGYIGSENFTNTKKLHSVYFFSKKVVFGRERSGSLTDIAGGADRKWRVTVYGKENSTIQKEVDRYSKGIVKFHLLEEGK